MDSASCIHCRVHMQRGDELNSETRCGVLNTMDGAWDNIWIFYLYLSRRVLLWWKVSSFIQKNSSVRGVLWADFWIKGEMFCHNAHPGVWVDVSVSGSAGDWELIVDKELKIKHFKLFLWDSPLFIVVLSQIISSRKDSFKDLTEPCFPGLFSLFYFFYFFCHF